MESSYCYIALDFVNIFICNVSSAPNSLQGIFFISHSIIFNSKSDFFLDLPRLSALSIWGVAAWLFHGLRLCECWIRSRGLNVLLVMGFILLLFKMLVVFYWTSGIVIYTLFSAVFKSISL